MIKERNPRGVEQKPYSAAAGLRKRVNKADVLSSENRNSKVSTNFTGIVPLGKMAKERQNDSQGFGSGGIFSASNTQGKFSRSGQKQGGSSIGTYVTKPASRQVG